MRKLILASMISLSVLSTQSNAVVGLATGFAPVTVTGAYLALGSAGVMGTTIAFRHICSVMNNCKGEGWIEVGIIGLSVIGIGVGLVILDDQSNMVKFNGMDLEQAKKLSITNQELDSYNTDLEILNAISEQATAATVGLNKEQAIEASKNVWTEGLDNLSAETKTAFAKLLTAK